MTNTHDEKIMNYKSDSYRDFIGMFDADEVEEMRRYLEHNYGYDYSYACESEVAELVAVDYIREWLIDNIRNITISGTEQLFKLVYHLQ